MTVGFVDTVEVGRLFAVRQYISRSNLQLSAPLSSTPCKPLSLFEPVVEGSFDGSLEAHTTMWDRERSMRDGTYMKEWYHPARSAPHVGSSNTTEREVD
jgi:hypothetical protein